MIQGNVCKRCRRMGVKLFLKGERCFLPKCSATRRPYPPGMHGQKRTRRASEYSKQLQEKQKAKAIYGLTEQSMKNYVKRAAGKGKNQGEELIKILESRLDNVLCRSGLASSRRSSRQMIGHGNVKIDDKKVDIPSYRVKLGQAIKLSSTVKNKPLAECPNWLKTDLKKQTVTIAALPTAQDGGNEYDIKLIIEFYAR